MATRIKEGMTGAEVAQIIDNGFDNLEELNQRVEINETALEDIKNMSFVSELMGIGTTKEEVNINYRGKSQGSSFEEEFQRTIPSASSLNAGVMTAADKTILDGLASKENLIIPVDEEDITSESGALKFKDKEYDEANFSGKGYKILRKNIQNGKNILTQDMINEPNTVYEIRYGFDLQEQTLVLPKEATLLFKGGSINNGIVQFNGGTIIGADKFEDCGNASFTGNWSKGLIMSFDDTPKWWNGTEWVAFASSSEEIPNFQAEVTSVETTDGQAEATVSLAEQKFSFTFAIPRGEKGDKGDTGEKGDTGDTGPQGVQGEEGPQGETGKTPVLQKGTIVTLEPTEDATFELVQSGTDGIGNPIYKLNLGVPKGNPGDGSGNVNVTNGASLETGKQYAFKPSADGSLKGTFTTIPAASSTANGLMSSDDKSKLDDMKQVWKVPSAVLGLTDESTSDEIVEAFGMPISNFHVRIASCVDNLQAEYKVYNSMKAFIGNYECLLSGHVTDGQYTIDFNYVDAGTLKTVSIIQVPGGPITFACKLSESGGSEDSSYYLPDNVYNLNAGATHAEILEAFGGEDGLKETIQAVKDKRALYIYTNVISVTGYIINVNASFTSTSTTVLKICYYKAFENNKKLISIICNNSDNTQSEVKVIYPEGYKLNLEVYSLTSSSSSEDISTAVGGESGLKEIIQAIKDGNRLVIRGTNDSLGGQVVNQDLMCNMYKELGNGDIDLTISGIGYGLFGGVAGCLIINYTKSSNTFSCSYLSIS